MASPNKSEKTMSSRLLTMKFMQRASASSQNSEPDTSEARPSKKLRLSKSPTRESYSSDRKAVEDAVAELELNRTQALEKHVLNKPDTKWTLEFKDSLYRIKPDGLNVISAGYGTIDSPMPTSNIPPPGDDTDKALAANVVGRKSFGKFNAALEKQQRSTESGDSPSSSDDGEESGSGSESEEQGNRAVDRENLNTRAPRASRATNDVTATRNPKRKPDNNSAEPKAAKEKKKEVKLRKLTSISNAGAQRARSGNTLPGGQACFVCGSPDHKKKDCPKNFARVKT